MKVEALKANLNNLDEEIAQAEKIGLGDFLISGALAAFVGVLSFIWGLPYLHPTVWDSYAIVGGVRPAAAVMPGYFQLIGGSICQFFGLTGGVKILQFAGHGCLVVVAVLVYMLLREVLAFVMRARPQYSHRRTLVMRAGGVIGALAFVLSDPVWTMGQTLSEEMVLLLLTLLATESFFAFLRKGSLAWAYLCAILLGLLCAETPLGFVLLFAFLSINHLVLNIFPVMESPFFRPEVIAVGKWYMTFLFMAALFVGIALNCTTYVMQNGFAANGMSLGALPLNYLLDYWGRIASAAGLAGWIMFLGVCVTPFIVSVVRFPSAADEESFLSYPTGIVFLVCGAVAFAQSASLPALWFWTYCAVDSTYLLAFGLLLSAVTLAAAVTILGVDFLCRNHRRLALQSFGGSDEELEVERRLSRRREGIPVLLRRLAYVTITAVLIVLMFPAHLRSFTKDALALVRDVVRETVVEAGDAEYLFTGGHLDTILELESAFRGHHLKCLPLVGGQSVRDKWLRTRGMENDAEDQFAFNYDVGMGLRTWIRDKPDRLKACAVQMGFDLWKRDGKALPPMGGLLSHPAGWADDNEREASVVRGHELCRRTLWIVDLLSRTRCPDERVRNVFNAVQWRLARMCLIRAEANDLAGKPEAAIRENDLGTALNDKNEIYQDIMESHARANEKMMTRLTPREGLQLALVRADFNMGRYYAKTILAADPGNGDANFAMGMYFAREKQWYRAEEYLMRCLLAMPNQPAIYNNLAMVQLELGKLDAAEKNAKKALEIIPDAAAVKETQNRIRKMREEKAEAKAKGAAPGAGKREELRK